jgi:hypothetical protein
MDMFMEAGSSWCKKTKTKNLVTLSFIKEPYTVLIVTNSVNFRPIANVKIFMWKDPRIDSWPLTDYVVCEKRYLTDHNTLMLMAD